jgi:hypothetical protein
MCRVVLQLTNISEVLDASIILIILMMEAVRTSGVSVGFYQTTELNITEDSHLHTHCYENLRKRLLMYILLKLEE